MRVDAGSNANHHYSPKSITGSRPSEKKISKAESPRIDPGTTAKESGKTSEKGVIRKLQEGHFKGVADVRLRTIFHAELQAAQKEDDLAQLSQTASQITETVSSNFDSLVGLAELEGETLQAANQLFAEFENNVAGVTTNTSDLQQDIADLRTAVDTFLSSLTGLVRPEPVVEDSESLNDPASEQPEIIQSDLPEGGQSIIGTAELPQELELQDAQTASLEPVDETNSDVAGEDDPFTQAYDKLATEVEGLFADLQSSLLESNKYEPEPPKNNGVAFEKFLAIYRQLNESAVEPIIESVSSVENPENELLD